MMSKATNGKMSLRERTWAGVSGRCENPHCRNKIEWGDMCWYDRMGDKDYCNPCGLAMRYHRKKASERGEREPVTFEDVEQQ